jgi:hypothetical protein
VQVVATRRLVRIALQRANTSVSPSFF